MQVHKRELVLSDTTDGKRERDARLAIVTIVVLLLYSVLLFSCTQ